MYARLVRAQRQASRPTGSGQHRNRKTINVERPFEGAGDIKLNIVRLGKAAVAIGGGELLRENRVVFQEAVDGGPKDHGVVVGSITLS